MDSAGFREGLPAANARTPSVKSAASSTTASRSFPLRTTRRVTVSSRVRQTASVVTARGASHETTVRAAGVKGASGPLATVMTPRDVRPFSKSVKRPVKRSA